LIKSARARRIRRLLWIYFWLLIFEGALRKWIFPSFSDPLLLARDPIALLTLFAGWPLLLHKRWLSFLLPLLFIGILAFTHGPFWYSRTHLARATNLHIRIGL